MGGCWRYFYRHKQELVHLGPCGPLFENHGFFSKCCVNFFSILSRCKNWTELVWWSMCYWNSSQSRLRLQNREADICRNSQICFTFCWVFKIQSTVEASLIKFRVRVRSKMSCKAKIFWSVKLELAQWEN